MKNIHKKWDEFENNWIKWNEYDIVDWFKYKLGYFRDITTFDNDNDGANRHNIDVDINDMLTKEECKEIENVDFNDMLKKMLTLQISGKSLHYINKSDLHYLGIKTFKIQ